MKHILIIYSDSIELNNSHITQICFSIRAQTYSHMFILSLVYTPRRRNMKPNTAMSMNEIKKIISQFDCHFFSFFIYFSSSQSEMWVERCVDWIVKKSRFCYGFLHTAPKWNNERTRTLERSDKNFNASDILSSLRRIKTRTSHRQLAYPLEMLERRRKDSNQFWWDTETCASEWSERSERSAAYRFVKHNQKQMCWTLRWWLECVSGREAANGIKTGTNIILLFYECPWTGMKEKKPMQSHAEAIQAMTTLSVNKTTM